MIDRYPDSPNADGLPECIVKVKHGRAVKVESAGVEYYDSSLPERKSPKKAA